MPRVWFVKLELVVGLVCAFIVSGVRVDSEESHDGLSRSQATAADSPSYFEEHVSSLRLLRDDGGVLARYKRATMTTGNSYKPTTKNDCPYAPLMKTDDGRVVEGHHTGCLKQNPKCPIYNSNVTSEEQAAIVKIHNELRSRVAQGLETAGKPGPQPPALLMNELAWDEELAKLATDWAVQCIDAQQIGEPMPQNPHDCTECRKVLNHPWPFVGQNVAWSATWSSDGSVKLQSQWPKHVHGWYDEVKDFSREEASHFNGDQPGQPLIAHYTQVVWGSTSKIGCGAAYYHCNIKNSKDNKIYKGQCLKYVCNYGPGGNIRGMKLYEQPCKAPSSYAGLCKTPGDAKSEE